MKKENFIITGMTCSACERAVNKAISGVNGVKDVNVNLLTGSAVVEFDENVADENKIVSAVESAGYGVRFRQTEKQSGKSNIKSEWQVRIDERKKETKKLRNRLIISVCFLVPLLYLSMGGMIGLPFPDFFNQEQNASIFVLIQFLLTSIVILVNKKFFITGTKALIKKSPNMDSLVMLGAGVSYVYGLVVLFLICYHTGQGNFDVVHTYMHSLYFESTATILTLVTLGKFLEGLSKQKTTSALDGLISLKPKTAKVLREGKEIEISADDIVSGDVVVVRVGDVLSVDGKIIEGNAMFDQSSITGESMPVRKKEGEKVISASICINGTAKVLAESVGENTTLSEIIKLVDEAGNSKAPIARLADKVSSVFVPVVISIALLTFLVWVIISGSLSQGLTNAVSVLVISCPCALGLATPVAIMVGSGVSAKNGILFKSAEVIENLSKAKTVILDKTGTITEGKLVVTDVVLLSDECSEKEVLSEVASVENHSNHPIAKAIISSFEGELEKIKNFSETIGEGVYGEIKAQSVFVGNLKFIEKNIKIESKQKKKIEAQISEFQGQGKTVIIYAKSQKLLAIIAISDKIREDSKSAIQLLKEKGMKIVMLSGDNKLTASAVAKELDIDEVIADVLPAEKEEVVRKYQSSGEKVIMVGDGINDSPALTRADIGMALGSGTDIAGLSADVILTRNSLMGVVDAISISRATLTDIKINLFWAFFYNILCIPLAAGVWQHFGISLNPMIASLAMSFSSVCVVVSALMLNLYKPKKNKIKREVKNMKKTIIINGMMCTHCVTHVTEALSRLDGVKNVDVSLEDKSAKILSDKEISDEQIIASISDAGYSVESIKIDD